MAAEVAAEREGEEAGADQLEADHSVEDQIGALRPGPADPPSVEEHVDCLGVVKHRQSGLMHGAARMVCLT